MRTVPSLTPRQAVSLSEAFPEDSTYKPEIRLEKESIAVIREMAS